MHFHAGLMSEKLQGQKVYDYLLNWVKPVPCFTLASN